MNKKALLIYFILFASIILAQDKTMTVKLTRNEKILNSIDLGDSGFILKTGKNYMNSKKLGLKLRYYDTSLNLIWEVPIVKTQINKGFSNNIIASPNGQYVFHVERKGYNVSFGATKANITVVNPKGETKVHEFEKIKEFGTRKMAFANNKFLYFLCTENGWELDDKKKTKEKLILNKIDNNTFEYNKIVLDLPTITNPEHTTFWRYAGHNNKNIYLYNKVIDKKTGEFKYNIIVIDNNGNKVKELSINDNLEGKYLRPSYNFKDFPGNYKYKDDDFYKVYKTRGNGSSRVILKPDLGAFGNIYVDIDNNSIYIYGLYGAEPFKDLGSKYEGYYIYKYDFEGNNIYKISQKVPSEMLEESFFKIHGAPEDRMLLLSKHKDKLILNIAFKKQVYTFDFSDKTGKYNKITKYTFNKPVNINTVRTCIYGESKAQDYINNMNKKVLKKYNNVEYFTSSKSEILIFENSRKYLLYFYLFSR